MDLRTIWISKYNKENDNEYKKYTFSGQYLVIYNPNHHLARKDGYVYIHQLQAEKKLKRSLLKGECVHHIDENKYNNDIDNLMIFNSVSDHTAFHMGNKIYEDNGIWHAYKKSLKDNNKKYLLKICPICNENLMDRKATMCRDCYNKRRSTYIPEKAVLENLILSHSMTEIGRIFSVSDNAVRKWCKKYELPFKIQDLKEYRKAASF